MVKNIKHCGGCLKGSCHGCSNYLGSNKAIQTTTAQLVTVELVKALGFFGLVAVLIIII